MSEELQQKTNDELRDMLKEQGLPVYGAKADLIARLYGESPYTAPKQNSRKVPSHLDIEYVVVKPFKYGDEKLEKGDTWRPDGGQWDAQIVDQQKFVKPLEVASGR